MRFHLVSMIFRIPSAAKPSTSLGLRFPTLKIPKLGVEGEKMETAQVGGTPSKAKT